MGMLYRKTVRPLLFNLDAEWAHKLGITALQWTGREPLRSMLTRNTRVNNLSREVFGINFPNPVGLAAGLDKNGVAIHGLEAIGFGFVTVGTVTPLPQEGNPQPRLFRLEEDHSIINRYGFNSIGVDAVAKNLKKSGRVGIPIFISVGANKSTMEKSDPLKEAVEDYLTCINGLHPYADAFELGVSSPNTPGLCDLQQREPLSHLCSTVNARLKAIANETSSVKKSLLLKISPDLTNQQFEDVLHVANECVDGLIIANTTLNHPVSLQSKYSHEKGGLSGTSECFERMILLVRHARWKYPNLPLIAVGGINSPAHAQRALNSGASLVQILTGIIYDGPFLARDINRGLQKLIS